MCKQESAVSTTNTNVPNHAVCLGKAAIETQKAQTDNIQQRFHQ